MTLKIPDKTNIAHAITVTPYPYFSKNNENIFSELGDSIIQKSY